MLSQEPQLAPSPLLACYLARFHRFFAAVIDYTREGDRPGMLLGGYLADALHNVPAMLWHCDANDWFNPGSMEAWMQEFPGYMMRMTALERLVADSRRILSVEESAKVLRLNDDFTNLDLAPLPAMRVYLDKLADACLMMRFMRAFGSRPPAVWNGLEQVWTEHAERAEAQAAFNLAIASALMPIPQALLQWGQFNEQAFHDAVLKASEYLPEKDHAEWVT